MSAVTLRPIQSSLLTRLSGVSHGFFTREGGVSEGLYARLNLGQGSQDNPEHVAENRRRAAGWFDQPASALNICYQIHSDQVHVALDPWHENRPKGDGVVTQQPGLICGALAADCAPILLADPDAGVVCAVHAGWRGALGGVIGQAVGAMGRLGASPAQIVAAIGPCIGPASYEVGLEFLDNFAAHAPGSEQFFAAGTRAEKRQFDLPGFALSRLHEAGVEQCEWTGHDTYADAERFYSNRRAYRLGEADYGRLLSAIMLR